MEPLNLKETALKEEIKEILEELENMYEISELEEQVNNINKIRDYIINLQQENKKQKEVIDKVAEYIEKHIKYECDDAYNGMQFYSYHLYDFNKQELLDILYEVSK